MIHQRSNRGWGNSTQINRAGFCRKVARVSLNAALISVKTGGKDKACFIESETQPPGSTEKVKDDRLDLTGDARAPAREFGRVRKTSG